MRRRFGSARMRSFSVGGSLRDRIVVTGAAGFIESSLTNRPLTDGRTVVGIDSFEYCHAREHKEANPASTRTNPAFTLVEQNLLDANLPEVLEEAACVYHLFARTGVCASWGDSLEVYVRNKVWATQKVLDACLVAGFPPVVHASSSSVNGDQDELPLRGDMTPKLRSPYGVTKLAGEHLLLLRTANHRPGTVSLHLFTDYCPHRRPDGAFQNFVRTRLEGRPVTVYGDGSQTRAFTYIDDIVEGLVRAPKAPAASVRNIGGGNRVSLAEAIATLGDVVGAVPKVDRRPVEAGDVRDTLADVSCLTAAVGYAPRTRLADGLAVKHASPGALRAEEFA